jgi:hypothetical protein
MAGAQEETRFGRLVKKRTVTFIMEDSLPEIRTKEAYDEAWNWR